MPAVAPWTDTFTRPASKKRSAASGLAGVRQHDAQDKNGDAHLKAGIVGPRETIPITNGKMGCPPGSISLYVNSTDRRAGGISW